MPSMSIREIDADVLAQFNRGAQARGWTQGQYLAALVALHDAMRALADTPTSDGRWDQVRTELVALGLATVAA